MTKSWCFNAVAKAIFNFNVMWYIESNIRAPVLLNLINSLRKSVKILGKPRIYFFSPTPSINSIKQEHSCKILYVSCKLILWCTLKIIGNHRLELSKTWLFHYRRPVLINDFIAWVYGKTVGWQLVRRITLTHYSYRNSQSTLPRIFENVFLDKGQVAEKLRQCRLWISVIE